MLAPAPPWEKPPEGTANSRSSCNAPARALPFRRRPRTVERTREPAGTGSRHGSRAEMSRWDDSPPRPRSLAGESLEPCERVAISRRRRRRIRPIRVFRRAIPFSTKPFRPRGRPDRRAGALPQGGATCETCHIAGVTRPILACSIRRRLRGAPCLPPFPRPARCSFNRVSSTSGSSKAHCPTRGAAGVESERRWPDSDS